MKRILIVLVIIMCFVSLSAESGFSIFNPSKEAINKSVDYVFPVYDGSLDSFTMRQFEDSHINYVSILSRSIDSLLYGNEYNGVSYSNFVKLLVFSFSPAFTHEEAHRSILTNLKIGSISQPFFNEQGDAYVKGVRDAELQNLRNTHLPMFIRLHTAGIESDYCIAKKEMEKMSLQVDSGSNLFFDHYVRIFNVFVYQVSGIADSYLTPAKKKSSFQDEEENELERDIVGHDVYGMVRHLFRPGMEFKRYTDFSELTEEEKKYVERIGIRSNLLIVNSCLIPINVIKFPEKISLNLSAGYCIAPFGDFIDENIFFKYDKFNISFYARQAQNRNSWFPAFGLGLVEYKPLDWFSATVRGHFWMQPENLDFNTTTGIPGGAGEVSLNFVLPNKNEGAVKGMGINIGALYKTKGFMPEIESHDAHFRMSAGLVVRY